ncbi:MAG: leucine-rich repeat domain-containing protein [Simkaniaceae bacterium]|nr:leucine-rich repeat domain-containing protein [Simkaniaceae bacterium]
MAAASPTLFDLPTEVLDDIFSRVGDPMMAAVSRKLKPIVEKAIEDHLESICTYLSDPIEAKLSHDNAKEQFLTASRAYKILFECPRGIDQGEMLGKAHPLISKTSLEKMAKKIEDVGIALHIWNWLPGGPVALGLLERGFSKAQIANHFSSWVEGNEGVMASRLTVSLVNRKLLSFPRSIFALTLTNIESINIENCALTSIPSEIGDFGCLKELILRNNQLQELPESIGDLKALERLIVEKNALQALPSTISRLLNLRRLNAAHNNLTTLPDEMNKMVKLNQIYLEGNCLTTVPAQISQLPNLLTLLINNTPGLDLPEEIRTHRALKFKEAIELFNPWKNVELSQSSEDDFP